MKPAVVIGMILVILGAISLIWGGISFTKSKENIDLGIAEVEVTEKETWPIHPAFGALALIGGVVLVVTGRKKSA